MGALTSAAGPLRLATGLEDQITLKRAYGPDIYIYIHMCMYMGVSKKHGVIFGSLRIKDPGEPVAHDYGLLYTNNGLLWGYNGLLFPTNIHMGVSKKIQGHFWESS